MKLILIIALFSFIGYDAIDYQLFSKEDLRFQIKLIDTQTVHQEGVTASAVLTNGFIVTGSDDGTVLIWDKDVRKEIFQSDHNAAVTALQALPKNALAIGYKNGGIVLASLSDDGSFSFNTFYNSMHTDKLNAFIIEIKSQTLISCSELTCNSWNLVNGKLIGSNFFKDNLGATLVIPTKTENLIIRYVNTRVEKKDILKPNETISFINDIVATAIQVIQYKDFNELLVIASHQRPFTLYKIEYFEILNRPVNVLTSLVTSFLFLSNGHLLTGQKDGSISIWSLFDDSEPIQTINGQSDAISSLTLLNNGNMMSTSLDSTVKIYSIVDTRLIEHLNGLYFALISDELIAIAGTDVNKIEIKNVTDGTLVKTLVYKGTSLFFVRDLLLLQNGDLLSFSSSREIRIWDLEKYEDKNVTFKASFSNSNSVVQLKNGNLVSINQDQSTFYISDVNTGEILRTVSLPGNNIYIYFGIKLLSENQVIFSHNLGTAVYVLDLADNSTARIGESTKGRFTHVLPLKYKKLVAFIVSGQLVFYESQTSKFHKEINISRDLFEVTSLVETSNGRLLVAFNDGSIKVVDIEFGTMFQWFTAHRLAISNLALMANENIVSLSRNENSIKIWKKFKEY